MSARTCCWFREYKKKGSAPAPQKGELSERASYRLLSLLEDGINVVFGLPHPRYTLIVIAELILEQQLELDKHDALGRLLVNLGAKGEPRATTEGGESFFVLGRSAVEA
jgi:hypothetical protein